MTAKTSSAYAAISICVCCVLILGLTAPRPTIACHGMPGDSWETFDGHWIGYGMGGRLDLEVESGVLTTFDSFTFVCGGSAFGEVWGYPGATVDASGNFSSSFTASSGQAVELAGDFDKDISSGTVSLCVNGCCGIVPVKRIGVLDAYIHFNEEGPKVQPSITGTEDANCSWIEDDPGSYRSHNEYFGDTTTLLTATCQDGMALQSWSMNHMPADVPNEVVQSLVDDLSANPIAVNLKAGVWLSLTAYCAEASLKVTEGPRNPTKTMLQTFAPGTPVEAAVNQIQVSGAGADLTLVSLAYHFSGDGTMEGLTGGALAGNARLRRDPGCDGSFGESIGTATVEGNEITFGGLSEVFSAGENTCYLMTLEFNEKALGTYAAEFRPGEARAVDGEGERALIGGGSVTGSLEVNLDTDGDALLDYWETYGYDDDGDGVLDVDLPTLGANPKHKDIFVEIDWMRDDNHSHKPKAVAITYVERAFKNAPVTNPDGINGITIHLDTGTLGGGNSVAHDQNLSPLWTEFDVIKDANFNPVRRRIFRYCLFAHNYNSTSSSGCARDIPASDFVVTLGSWNSHVGTTKQQAGTLMHELGHTLGLRHGGKDHMHYKPNFLSIMNYAFQVDWLRYNGKDCKLDYSRFEINRLRETDLNEAEGLTATGPGKKLLPKYGTRFYTDYTQAVVNDSSANVDWNGNGELDPDAQGDINGDGRLTGLSGNCNDWDNLLFKGGTVGAAGELGILRVMGDEPAMEELTVEEYRRMKRHSVVVDSVAKRP